MKTDARNKTTLTLILILIPAAWLLLWSPAQASSSAVVGRGMANTSAGALAAEAQASTGSAFPQQFFSYNSSSAVGLSITDLNDDGDQDIVVTVTTPEIKTASTAPGGLGTTPAKYGLFVSDGSTGLTLVNLLVTSP